LGMDTIIKIGLSLLFLVPAGLFLVWWIRLVWRRGSKNHHHTPPSSEATSGPFHSHGPI